MGEAAAIPMQMQEQGDRERDALAQTVQQLQHHLQALQQENESLARRAQQAGEDAVRMRRQLERETARARAEGEALAVRALVPALAALGEAATQIEAREPQVASGLQMLAQELERGLDEAGFARIEDVGADFDPDLHEAVAAQACAAEREGTVLRAVAPGFVRKQGEPKLVCPARVVVGRQGGHD